MVFTTKRRLRGTPTVCVLVLEAALATAMIARKGPKDAADRFHPIGKRIGPRRAEELAAYHDAHTTTILDAA